MSHAIQTVADEDFIEGVLTRRCLAWLIDFLVIAVLASALYVLLMLFGVLTLGLGFAAMAILPAVPFLYHFLCLLRVSSATPGQAVMGLTVRRDADLGPPDPFQALVFTAMLYVTLLTSGLLLFALFTLRHRALHDLISGLVVVRRGAFNAWMAQQGMAQQGMAQQRAYASESGRAGYSG